MTLTVEINSDQEEVLRKAARAVGMDIPTFLLDSAQQRLKTITDSPSEASLLEQVASSAPPASLRHRRLELLEHRDNNSLTPLEEKELFTLQEQLENLQFVRWRAIGELAKRRGKTLIEMADALGIPPSEVR